MTPKALKQFSKYFDVDFSFHYPVHKYKKNPDKDLYIADLHAPWHARTLLKQTLDDNTDCRNLWIIGDGFDMYSKSHYRKTTAMDFRQEFREAFTVLQETAQHFDKVYVLLSNHDQRFRKWFFDNIHPDCLPFVRTDFVEDLIQTIPNVKVISHRVNFDNENRTIEYIYQHRNVLFTHIEKSASDVSKAVQEITKTLTRWEHIYKLKPYDVIIQAHNHQSARVKVGGKTLYQIPCLINYALPGFDYVFSGRLYNNPPALGYIVAHYGKGLFNPNKSILYDLI